MNNTSAQRKTRRQRIGGRLIIALAMVMAATTMGILTPAGTSKAAISQTPIITGSSLPPRVMLLMSRNHQLYAEAYTDYSDLSGDGSLDTTYTDEFDYYGYFDSGKCYSYGSGRFSPSGSAGGPNGHHCSGGWSGNFLNWATMTRMDVLRKVLFGGFRSTDSTSETVLERVILPNDTHAFAKIFRSNEMSNYTPYTNTAITMCNVTFRSSDQSQDVDTDTSPPTVRIAQGEWPAWAANEVVQCDWDRNNLSPSESSDELATLNVRVSVCESGMLEDNCRTYSSGDKPTGLLQRYGEGGGLLFGLLTGSYEQNKSGGVVRRNINQIAGNEAPNEFRNEIDLDTGQFINQGSSAEGIINTINRLRLSHWDYSTHKYEDGCASPGILSFSNGECSNWGNPLGEMFLEALRYYAGAGSPQYSANDGGYIDGLSEVSDWDDPMSSDEYCAVNNVVVLSTGASSFDAGGAAEYSATSSLYDFPGISSATDTVGSGEGISGQYFYGGANGRCTAKALSGLSNAVGLCPEVPSLEGGYGIAGLAWYAHTSDIRDDRQDDQQVTTYAFNLAETLPRIEVGGIDILPACEANSNGGADDDDSGWRACSLIQFNVANLQQAGDGSLESATFYAFWEDSTWGNDYDMDGIVQMDVCAGAACNDSGVGAGEVKVTTEAVQAFAGHALRFGYTVAGSGNDGIQLPVLRPGGQNFSVFGGASINPGNQPPPSSETYSAGGATADYLENPLWYAAKWGGFNDLNDSGEPDATEQWDSDGDGVPDNYFPIRDPGKLEEQLDNVFGDIIAQTGSTAAATTNTGIAVQGEATVYQPLYRSGDWSGDLLAFSFDSGTLPDTPDAVASDQLDGQNWNTGREIITFTPAEGGDPAGGAEFRWSDLTPTQQAALDGSDGLGEERLEYLRGDDDNEGSGLGFRVRNTVLGDIVDSSPVYVADPRNQFFRLPGTEGESYIDFAENNESRRPMIYVGANDGMLHGFDGETLEEDIAYVPFGVYDNLRLLTAPDYGHRFFVNGTPTASDAYLNGSWESVLVGSTGAGGRSIFALDITNPGAFQESNAGDLVKWEIHPALNGDYADLGYTFSRPAIVRMANGSWAAVFGNGYESDTGNAVLYIADLDDGSLIKSFELDGGPGNGLSTPIAVDLNDDLIIDRIYAGDRQGNLWKVDVSDANTNQWRVAGSGSGSPLFTATSMGGAPQPITVRPEVIRHPTDGQLVLFGTGQYIESGDDQIDGNTVTQSFYGVWDPDGSPVVSDIGRGDLQRQEIVQESTSSGREVRVTSNNTVDYDSEDPEDGDLGWYIDFDQPTIPNGERVIRNPVVRSERLIFPTLIPSGDQCTGGGTGWLMELNPVTGGRLPFTPFDVNNDGVFDADDYVPYDDGSGEEDTQVSGMKIDDGIPSEPAIVTDPESGIEYKFITTSGGTTEAVPNNPGPRAMGRQNWQQLK